MGRRILLAAAVGSFVLVTSASGAPTELAFFQTPSKNIACGYATGFGPASLRCDIRSGLRPEPRGACELDWTGVSMNATGRARPACAGDTVASPSAYVLHYGRMWARTGFMCLSSRIGLMCTNRTGNGFFLSKERWQVS